MATSPACPVCGEPLPSPGSPCPVCKPHTRRREPVLILLLILGAAGLWGATQALTRAYQIRQRQLAREWFDRGEQESRAMRLAPAIADLETALAYAHDDFDYRLRLAQALAAANRTDQARAYLSALWDREPGNATVNLELARLAVRGHDVLSALRFYHGAIYGVWQDDPAARRREAWLELAEFLLRNHASQQAQSELIALAADLPRDPALLTRVGGLFLQAGAPRRALEEYRQALAIETNSAALAGAGQAAFQVREFTEARSYLRRAVVLDPNDQASAKLLRVAELVLQMDPLARGLTSEERARRVARAVEQAQYRLEVCAQQQGMTLGDSALPSPLSADYAQLLALKPRVRPAALRRDPALVDSAMQQVSNSERDAARLCGAPAGEDRALLLISERRQGAPE